MPIRRVMPSLAALGLLAACAEEKVTYYRPMFSGLPGVESNTPITDAAPRGAVVSTAKDTGEELVRKSPDNKKTLLVARNGRELMVHIYTTIDGNDGPLFVDQVLSKLTKDEYYERGRQPGEAFAYLRANFQHVKRLFDQMPMGEFTPGMYLEPVGPNVMRLELHDRKARGLAWTGFDMVREGADYRLRWFTGPGPGPGDPAQTSDTSAPAVVVGPKRE